MAALNAMTIDELHAETQRLMAERDAHYAKMKTALSAVQDEINKRAARAKLDGAFAGLSPEARAEMIAEMGASTDG